MWLYLFENENIQNSNSYKHMHLRYTSSPKTKEDHKENIVTDVTHEVTPHFVKHWTDYLVIIAIFAAFANIYIYINSNEDTSW